MRASRTSVFTGLALLIVAPIPLATAISAAAMTTAPRTLGVDDVGDTAEETVQKAGEKVHHVTDSVDELVPEPEPAPEPAPEPEPERATELPEPLPEAELPVPAPEKPAPNPTVTVPKPAPVPAPVPAPAPAPEAETGAHSGSDGSSGAASRTAPRRVGTSTGGEPTGSEVSDAPAGGDRQGTAVASAGPLTSSVYYEGPPLLPEANAGDPNIRSLLISGGQRSERISPVGDDTAGSVTGLLVLGTLASVMLYGSAAYLKFGKRRPATGKHKA